MLTKLVNFKTLLFATIALAFIACEDDDTKANLRTSIDYNTLSSSTPYAEQFVDVNGNSTVNVTEGNHLHKMFQALNYQATSAVSSNTQIQASKMKNLFSNSGSPFSDISTATISVNGSELNASAAQLKAKVGSSLSSTEADVVRAKIETLFDELQTASQSVANTAAQGQAGKLGTYLVDAKGIETIQVIQKSLIGALQYDYIANVLLDEGLNADNHTVVSDQNYTQLEHNWDVAYGLLTLNPVYLSGATDGTRNTVEFGAGAYIWEYNKSGYPKIFPAFVKGRAAIVNNDKAELEAQATIIKTEFEKAIASAALGYLDKWKTGTSDAARAHAIGEGLGFIYSLRFMTIHNADAAFSDNLINGLTGSANGFWDLTAQKITTASDAIKAKFNL